MNSWEFCSTQVSGTDASSGLSVSTNTERSENANFVLVLWEMYLTRIWLHTFQSLQQTVGFVVHTFFMKKKSFMLHCFIRK